MTNRIFKEVRSGVVAHTALSKAIAEDKALRDWIGFSTEDMWPVCFSLLLAGSIWKPRICYPLLISLPGCFQNCRGYHPGSGFSGAREQWVCSGKWRIRC
jgi:hypothetical protein